MKHLNNRGITMIELICTVALFSIIGLAAMSMMATVARMNHVVALQQKQARESEVLINELRKYIQYEDWEYATEQKEGCIVTITIPSEAEGVADKTIIAFALVDNDLLYYENDHERVIAEDVASFSITPDTDSDASSYVIKLTYENGNTFDWVLSPRL